MSDNFTFMQQSSVLNYGAAVAPYVPEPTATRRPLMTCDDHTWKHHQISESLWSHDWSLGLFLGRRATPVTAFPCEWKKSSQHLVSQPRAHFCVIGVTQIYTCAHFCTFDWGRKKHSVKKQKGGGALAWCLTVSTTQQLEQNSAMPQCCGSKRGPLR